MRVGIIFLWLRGSGEPARNRTGSSDCATTNMVANTGKRRLASHPRQRRLGIARDICRAGKPKPPLRGHL
jgi:hypothetical protein